MIATGDDSEPALRLRLTGEGGCVFLDGTCGIGKSGMGSPLGTMSVEKKYNCVNPCERKKSEALE